MKQNSLERLSIILSELQQRIYAYCNAHPKSEQILGTCIANPKYASIPIPTSDIQKEFERRATEYFKNTSVFGYYFHYWTPPILPIRTNKDLQKTVTAEDYQLTFEIPMFDEKWQQTTSARSLIYCPSDHEIQSWSDWFELQFDAIRFTPMLHQTLKECKIKFEFKLQLAQPGIPVFVAFIYGYSINDPHFPEMSKHEKESWSARKIDWKIRYKLAADVIKSAKTLMELYSIVRNKAASSRNPMLKDLFWAFVEHIEQNLVIRTELPEEEKKQLLCQLRKTSKRPSKGDYIAKRPAVSISDIECAQILYLLIREFQASKGNRSAIAEVIFFIWIAQHAAFSGLRLTVDDILNIRVTDVCFENLTIQIEDQEVNITKGLSEIFKAWFGEMERKNKRRLFQTLSYDLLEDILGRISIKFYGKEGKMLPRDFLTKVHVMLGARISLELRRQIEQQEELVKHSPYRINPRIIKKHIKESIEKKRFQK